ncbi:MAG: DUF1540 domain-containing protein [Clostridium sp.]
MTTLGCSVQKCVNNEGGFCGANSILISGADAYTSHQTQCENYEPETILNAFKAIPNTNFLGELAQIVSTRDEIKITPEVVCTAENCLYNNEGMCGATNIIIIENNINRKRNQCETFIEGR